MNLRMEGISKQFGEVFANNNINLEIREGEVHTLLGENGAGKSTLMNILIGLYAPTAGKIFINDREVHIDSPKTAVRYGIGMVHQHFMLVEAMSVFDNIILGHTGEKGLFIPREKLRKEILALSEKYELEVELDKNITEISVGAQQRVEILKALFRGADLLILDEPTAALTDLEAEGLFKIMRKLTSENKSVVFISHKMREVLEISSRITILRAGRTVRTLERTQTDGEELANLMIGHKMVQTEYDKKISDQPPVFEMKHVSYNKNSKHNGLNDISLTIRKGEIVGIAGIDGNGQSQLARIATGVLSPDAGEVDLKNSVVSKFLPIGFIAANVAHIPEDRNKMGLIGNMSVAENLILQDTESPRFSAGKGLYLKKKAIRSFAVELQKKNDIRCVSVDQEVRNLSGGNQQKVILARELDRNPDHLVAVHPTRGLDIGATQFVHDSMIDARDKGCGILLVSADFDEILKISDRIIVMFEGKIMGEYSGENPPINEISLAMAGK